MTVEDSLRIGLACGPADEHDRADSISLAYDLAGLPAPRIVAVDSPLAGVRVAAEMRLAGAVSVRAEVRTRPWAAARAAVLADLGPIGFARHWAATATRPWRQLVDQIVTPLRRGLEADVAAVVLREALLDVVYGQHDAAWLGAFAGRPEVAGLAAVAGRSGWWWPYADVAVVSARPVEVHRDNVGRLHHGDGPALAYPDGWGLWAWRGMPIPPEVVPELATLTVDRIRAEDNAELRRVMLEHFGYDRYLRESGAKEVGRDECGILWRVALPGDEPLVMVEVVNSTPEPDGTSRVYFLRVPPSVRTAREGVAWTFDVDPDDYTPFVQT
jgi:Domain of unknown function (DUF6745)